MQLKNRKGFTLIEVIVVAGIIAILAGILVPLIFKEIDESRITRATADIKSIATSMLVLKKDTGQWPVSSACANNVTILNSSSGTLPALAAGWDSSSQNSYDQSLSMDDNNCWPPDAQGKTLWKGPYMAIVNPDPWGHAYVTNANAFLSNVKTPPPAIWIISAGPDGVLDTPAAASAPQNDDIGIRLQ